MKQTADLETLVDQLTAAVAKPEAGMLKRALPNILTELVDCNDQAVDCLIKIDMAAAIVDADGQIVLVNGGMLDMFSEHNKPQVLAQLSMNTLYSQFSDCYFFCVPICNSRNFKNSKLLVSYSELDILKLMADQFSGPTPTHTEVNVLVRMINGFSLRQISEQDGVAYETRRYQFKQILAKFNLTKNTDLIALVLTRIHSHLFTLLLDQFDFNKRVAQETSSVTFFRQIYGASLRTHHHKFGDSYQLTVFDLGPIDGHPVLCMHPINMPIYPCCSKTDVLYKMNLRIICPAMPGYCGSGPVTGLDVQLHCAAIDDFLLSKGINQCALLSVHTGVHMATEYIGETRIGLNSVVYINCYLKGKRQFPSTGISKLTHGFWSMMSTHSASLFKPILRLGMSIIKNKASFRSGYMRMYKNCPVDYELALELLDDPGLIGTYRLIEDCEDGFFACLNRATTYWHQKLEQLGTPITLVYGDSDPHNGQAEIEAWGKSLAQVKLVKLKKSAVLDAYARPERALELLEVNNQVRQLTAAV